MSAFLLDVPNNVQFCKDSSCRKIIMEFGKSESRYGKSDDFDQKGVGIPLIFL